MKMGKLLLGKMFTLAVVLAVTVVLSACGPTLLAGGEPPVTLSPTLVLDTEDVKTSYLPGEFFDPTGLTVSAAYSDGSRKPIAEGWTYDETKPLTLDEPYVTISYKEGDSTASANLGVAFTVYHGGESFSDTAWWGLQDDGAVYNDDGDVLLGWKGAMAAGYALEIRPGTTVIAERAFYNRATLTAVTIPDSVVWIGAEAFNKSNVTRFEIPNSVTFIGENALSAAVSNTVSVGAGVVYDLEKSFDRTKTTMLSVTGNANYTASSNMLFNKDCTVLYTALTSLDKSIVLTQDPLNPTGPSPLKEISPRAFYNCKNITHVTLPAGLEKIGNIAFAGTGITNVSIPASVTDIGRMAFSGCTKLTEVYLNNNSNTATIMGTKIFAECSALVKVEVYDKVIPSIISDVFPNNANLKIMISKVNNVSRVADVRAMSGWSHHAAKIIDLP